MQAIVVIKRFEDYHAHLEGSPEIWGAGITTDAAIGNLISSHCVTFGVGIRVVEIPDEPNRCNICGSELDGGPLKDPETLAKEIRDGVCDSCYTMEVSAGDTF